MKGKEFFFFWVNMRTWLLQHLKTSLKHFSWQRRVPGLFATKPTEPSLFGAPPGPPRKSALRPDRSAVGASAKAAAAGEPPLKKPKKTDAWHLPEVLQNLEGHPEKLEEALALGGAFHVMELGLLEEWLGHGLIVAWTAHTAYPVEAMTVGLVELISKVQADPANSAAANALAESQRAILKGLVTWEVAVDLYVKTYRLCVTARKDLTKEEIVVLLECLPPVVRLLSDLSSVKKYSKQKAHKWQQDVTKLLTLAYLSLEAHRVTEEVPLDDPAEEPAVTQMDDIEEEEEEDEEEVDMAALAAVVNLGGD